jgi:hypothetical protein
MSLCLCTEFIRETTAFHQPTDPHRLHKSLILRIRRYFWLLSVRISIIRRVVEGCSDVSEEGTESIFIVAIWIMWVIKWLENGSGSAEVHGAYLPTVGPKKGRS